MTRTILCFGDSLTWGWKPRSRAGPTTRWPKDVRWTGVLAAVLGPGFDVIEEGLNARTTNLDDPLDPRVNGSRHLPSALASHLPLDLVVLLLGTNDTKQYFHRSAFDIASGAAALLRQVTASVGGVGTTYPAPRVLLVAPPLPAERMPDPWFTLMFDGAREKLAAVRDAYRALAASTGAAFFDAGAVIPEVGADGLHLSEQNNAVLGRALAEEVRHLLPG